MKWIWRTIGVIGLAVLASACHQNDTAFVVDTTDDTVDSNPGDGFCNDANGECSLRAAVMEANALPGVEEIRLVDGETYVLTIPGTGEDLSATGDLDISSPVVILGDAWLEAGGLFEQSVHLLSTDGLVELDGVDFRYGAGVRAEGTSTALFVANSDAENVAGWMTVDGGTVVVEGASIFNAFGARIVDASSGSLTMANVTIAQSSGAEINVVDARVSVVHATFESSSRFVNDGAGEITLDSTYVSSCTRNDATSLGYNASYTDLCEGLDHPTDLPSTGYFPGNFDDPLERRSDPVRVYLPRAGSELVDGGRPSGCPAVDARDVARPFGSACDIGAVEIRPSPDCDARGSDLNLRFCDFSGARLDGEIMRNADFTGSTISSASFFGADLRDSNFERTRPAAGVDFAGADLRGAALGQMNVSLQGAKLDGATLIGVRADPAADATFVAATLIDSRIQDAPRADFTEAVVRDTSISLAEAASLRNALLENATLGGMEYADLSGLVVAPIGATVIEGWFTGSSIDGADLSAATIRFVRTGGLTGTPASLPSDVVLASGYLFAPASTVVGGDFVGVDLGAADFGGGFASGSDFSGARMPQTVAFADLSFTTLDGADMSGSSARSTALGGASLIAVDLSGTELRSSGLPNAQIVGSDFSNADLRWVNFTDAIMLWNTFDNTICPSGVNSDDNGGNCDGQFVFGAPQPPGAPVPEEFQGREAEFATFGGNE